MQRVSQKGRQGHLIHFYRELPPERRPQDPTGDGAGWTFELLEHGGEYPDAIPQAIRATDAQGRSCVYVPIKEDGRVVDSCGFKLVKSEDGRVSAVLSSALTGTLRRKGPVVIYH